MKHIATLLFALLAYNLCVAQQTDTEDLPFTIVEVMPVYPGGDTALVNWVGRQVHYPKEAIKKKIEGVVYVSFIIGKDGSIESASIARGVHPLLDEEAMRAVKEIKGFTPGYQRGKPVRVQFTIPLRFKL